MDSVDVVLAGDAHNVFDIKISVDRALALADKISFVGTVAVQ